MMNYLIIMVLVSVQWECMNADPSCPKITELTLEATATSIEHCEPDETNSNCDTKMMIELGRKNQLDEDNITWTCVLDQLNNNTQVSNVFRAKHSFSTGSRVELLKLRFTVGRSAGQEGLGEHLFTVVTGWFLSDTKYNEIAYETGFEHAWCYSSPLIELSDDQKVLNYNRVQYTVDPKTSRDCDAKLTFNSCGEDKALD